MNYFKKSLKKVHFLLAKRTENIYLLPSLDGKFNTTNVAR